MGSKGPDLFFPFFSVRPQQLILCKSWGIIIYSRVYEIYTCDFLTCILTTQLNVTSGSSSEAFKNFR